MNEAAKKLIIALDDPDIATNLEIIEATRSYASTYKLGLSLFCAHGPDIVKTINALNVRVFLDLKLHDIPMQVARAIENALVLEPRFITVHALGGTPMLKEAAAVVRGSNTKLLAVSVLTSLSDEEYHDLGFKGAVDEGVVRLLEKAFDAGISNFVASPHEAQALKQRFKQDCYLVCPGVRLSGGATHDQTRIMTPKDAIGFGADELVVGRPITASPNASYAAAAVHREIQEALAGKNLINESQNEMFA